MTCPSHVAVHEMNVFLRTQLSPSLWYLRDTTESESLDKIKWKNLLSSQKFQVGEGQGNTSFIMHF